MWANSANSDATYDLGIYTDTSTNMSIFSIVTPHVIAGGPWMIFNGDNNGTHRLWQFRVYNSKVDFIRFTSGGIYTVTSTNNVTLNDINVISATHDTNNGGAIYLNGVQEATDANGSDMLATELPSVALGAYQLSTDAWGSGDIISEWRGTIACAYMWGRSLNPAEHASLHRNPYQFLIPA